jgi:hypothetical protein
MTAQPDMDGRSSHKDEDTRARKADERLQRTEVGQCVPKPGKHGGGTESGR